MVRVPPEPFLPTRYAGSIDRSAIDAAWQRLSASVCGTIRPAAGSLPGQLGFGNGATQWSSYATLPPIVDLPFFVAPGAAPELLAAAREAHWRGGFLGLALDRLADGQASRGVRGDLLDALREAWVESLSVVSGARAEASSSVDEVLARAAAGFAMESVCAQVGTMDVQVYADIVREKTAWFGLASRMLFARSRVRDLHVFDELFEQLMLSLQTFDDAEDEHEDRLLRGRSIPDLLGLAPTCLVTVSAELARLGRRAARRCGLDALDAWLEERETLMATASVERPLALDFMGAAMLLERVKRRASWTT